MNWKWMQRHRWLRCALCLLLAVLISMSPMVKALVVAHASMSLTAVVAVVGTMLASVGITFATADALQRGVLTFYNGITADMRSFVDDSVQQYQSSGGGNNFLLLIPMLIMLPLAKLAAEIFPRDAKEVPDASTGGAAGDAGWVNPADNWRNFVGQTIQEFKAGTPVAEANTLGSLGFPIPIVLNSCPSGYIDLNSRISIPVNSDISSLSGFSIQRGWDSVLVSPPPLLLTSGANVFRVYGVLGQIYDYQLHVSFFKDPVVDVPFERLHALLEVTENDIVVSSFRSTVLSLYETSDNHCTILNMVPYFSLVDSLKFCLGLYTVDSLNLFKNASFGPDFYSYSTPTSSSTGLASGVLHTSNNCTIGGVFDKETGKPIDGAIPIPYLPDTGISADNLIKEALEKYLKENPELTDADVSIPVSVPTNADDVIGKGWDDVMTDTDIKEAIKDAIREWEEENPTYPPPVDPGGPIKPPVLVPPSGMFGMFPFCIPFDMALAFNCFVAEPVAPVFEIPFKYGNIVDEKITLDLSQWDFVLSIIRWGELIVYTVGLAVVTRNFIKW